jgi:hypothetical protein
VSGIPLAAAAADAVVMPGTMEKAMPASSNAAVSSAQTPEDCRVAAFEANKRAAWLCEAHEQSVDLVLRDATCTRALPDAEPACPARDQVEDRIADQRVIENDIRGSECVERSHR